MTATVHTTRRAVLAALPAAGAAAFVLPAAAATPGNPDPALSGLAAAFGRARAAWQAVAEAEYSVPNYIPDDLFEAATEAVLEVVREIEAAGAETLDGLRLKAAALSWCREAFLYEGVVHEEELDLHDQRLVGQLIEGLTGEPQRARRGFVFA